MGKTTSIKRDIFILLAVILLWIVMSVPTTGDKPHIRIIISLIFLIPVIYQIKRVVRKVKAEDKLK